jgi:hypothetical protein
VILHCLSRTQKAANFSKESIKQMANEHGTFIVHSPSGKQHKVQFRTEKNTPQCTCKDWIRWHIPCKHFFAVFTHFPEWGWASLPKVYLENEYLSTDSAAFFSTAHDGGDIDNGEQGNALEGKEAANEIPQRHVSQTNTLS